MLIDPTEVGLYTTSQEAVMAEKLITNFGFVKLSSSSKNRGPFSPIRAEYIEEQKALLKN